MSLLKWMYWWFVRGSQNKADLAHMQGVGAEADFYKDLEIAFGFVLINIRNSAELPA